MALCIVCFGSVGDPSRPQALRQQLQGLKLLSGICRRVASASASSRRTLRNSLPPEPSGGKLDSESVRGQLLSLVAFSFRHRLLESNTSTQEQADFLLSSGRVRGERNLLAWSQEFSRSRLRAIGRECWRCFAKRRESLGCCCNCSGALVSCVASASLRQAVSH